MRRRARKARVRACASFVPLSGLGEEACETIELIGREARVLDERVDDLFGAAIEEGAHEMAKRRPLRLLARNGWQVDVALAVDLVAEVALLLEEPERGSHRRIARRIGQVLEHLRGCRAS